MPEANFNSLPPIYAWRMLQREQDEQQAAQQADRKLGAVFNRMYPTQQPAQQMPPPGLPPPPGTPMGGPQAPPPGANMAPPQSPAPGANMAPPMAQGGGIQPPPQTAGPPPGAMPTPAAAPPPPIPPFRPMPGAGPTSPVQGGIAPPPAAPAASEVVSPEVQNFLPKFIDAMRKENIPTEQWQMMLERLPPAIKDQMALQVRMTHEQNQALIGWANAQSRAQTADASTSRADSYSRNVDSLIKERQVGAGAGGVQLTPGGMKLAAEMARAGINLPGGFGKTGISRGNAILNEMAKDEEGGAGSGAVAADRAAFKGTEAAIRDRSKFVAASQQFVRNLNSQMTLVEKYLKPGVGGSVPVFNKWIQAGRTQIAGDPDVTALDTTLRGLAREHQRIVTGVTSNAQLHASAQATADELLNKSQTEDQIRAALKVMREESENAVKAGQDELASQRSTAKSIVAKPVGAYSGDDAGKKRGDAPSAPARQTATNPKTGEKVELVDGKWQPVQ